MHVVILGSTNTGASLARRLEQDKHDVTIIDTDQEHLDRLRGDLDISVLASDAISGPIALRDAGLESDSILAAVSRDDVVNMHACFVARTLLNCGYTLCRLTSNHYEDLESHITSRANAEGFVDTFIYPHTILARNITDLLLMPGITGVREYWSLPFIAFSITAQEGGKHVDQTVGELLSHRGAQVSRVLGIERAGKSLEVTASTQISANDNVTLLAEKATLRELARDLRQLEDPYETVTIAGGGSTGVEVAKQLAENGLRVTLIEIRKDRAQHIRARLPNNVTVIHADTQDLAKLREAHVFDTDVYIAATGNDAENIITTQYAARQGVRRVICVLRARHYAALADEVGAEVMFTGTVLHQEITRFMNKARARIIELESPSNHAIAEIKLEQGGIAENFIGMHIEDVELPKDCEISALVRGEEALMVEDQLPIRQGDSLLILTKTQRAIRQLDKQLLSSNA